MSNRNWRPYEEKVGQLMSRHQIPGAAVAVAEHGELAYQNFFGWRDVERQLPLDEDTVFGIASVTKSFTAAAIMQLHEQDKLSVTDPVIKYLPEFRMGKDGAEKSMTIHHFLSHTSGIPPLFSLTRSLVRSFWEDDAMMEGERGEKLRMIKPIDTPEELMEYMASLDVQLLGSPGEYYSYSNECYGLLGLIVTRVSGMDYVDHVDKHIFSPLGMTRSFFSTQMAEEIENSTTLYSSKPLNKNRDYVFPSPEWWEAPSMTACGFMKSTLKDMVSYMEIYRTGGVGEGTRVLSEASIEQMCSPYAAIPTGGHYGYGLMIHGNYRGVSLVEHGGNLKGVASWVTCVRERGLTGVSLTTLTTAPSHQLLLGALNTVLGLPVNTKRQPIRVYECPKDRLQQYAGAYKSREQETEIKISATADGLSLIIGEQKLHALPVGVDAFAVRRRGEYSLIRFLRDAGSVRPWAVFAGFRIVPRVLD